MPISPNTTPWTRLAFTLHRWNGRTEHLTLAALVDGPITWYRSDASERCAICGGRWPEDAYYVGRTGALTDEGLPERIPVCSEAHGRLWGQRLAGR